MPALNSSAVARATSPQVKAYPPSTAAPTRAAMRNRGARTVAGPESIREDGVDMASGYCLFVADAIVQNRQLTVRV
ncbi:hypothetical protein GCM10027400_21590 [Pseudoxanthomonas daejeonensis]